MKQLSIYEFGRQLIESGDIDPVYILVWNAKMPPEKLKHWLLAYWCFYHIGTASWIVDQPDYWEAMRKAAGSKEWPRCPERRHFRGKNATDSVKYLESRGVRELFSMFHGSRLLKTIMTEVTAWVGFGPWIAFKAADMLDRCGVCQVEFDQGVMFLFDSPKEGANMLALAESYKGLPKDTQSWAVKRILTELGDLKAPPQFDRVINSQEAETILCKFKSYVNGKYKVGHDIHECRLALLRFAKCKTSQQLLASGREAGLWYQQNS